MKSVWKWPLVGGGAFLGVFILALPFVGGLGRASCGLLGRGGFGSGMMGGGYPMMGFGILPMLGMMLVPPAVVVLGVVGVAVFLRSSKTATPPAALVAATCANCGQTVKTDWVACPHCGQKQ